MKIEPISILLVEDNNDEANRIKELIKSVRLINEINTLDLSEAINYKGNIAPDLILVDLHISAKEVKLILDKMKANENFSSDSVIIFADNDIDEEIMRLDGVSGHYLRRPFDIQKFLTVIFTKLNFGTVLAK